MIKSFLWGLAVVSFLVGYMALTKPKHVGPQYVDLACINRHGGKLKLFDGKCRL